MSINNEYRAPAVIDSESRRLEETQGDDPAKQFRLSLGGKELIKDEYFGPVTLDDFRDPQNELQRVIKEHQDYLLYIRSIRQALIKIGAIYE